MPELPEVETIRRGLKKYLIGHRIEGVRVNYAKIFEGGAKGVEEVKGGRIIKIRRFAKVLVIDLDNGRSIVIQIKMTGQLLFDSPEYPLTKLSKKVIGGVGDRGGKGGKHTRVIFYLDRGGVLYYNDVRKFGRIRVTETDKVTETGLIGKLGPEPLGDLTLEKFREILKLSKRPIKLLLLDQTKIGGIGNIYANDALWLARLSPKAKASGLSDQAIKKLFDSILTVLEKGIETGGASEQAYVAPDGSEGGYQKHFLVYGRQGELCSRCRKEKIVKIQLGGRGTYYCPLCQE